MIVNARAEDNRRVSCCCRADERGVHTDKEPKREMTPQFVVNFAQEAIQVTIFVCLPILVMALLAGLVISIFQAVTQINEMTLTFVPKILVVLVGLLFLAPWMLEHLMTFTITIMTNFPDYIRQ
jgi:flagellar biosynthesis protein FliQ